MSIYNIDYNKGKYTVQKENKKGAFNNVSKHFNDFEEANKYARKIMNEKSDIILTDIPF